MENFKELLKDKKVLGFGALVFVFVFLLARRKSANAEPELEPSLGGVIPQTGGGGFGGGAGQLPPVVQPIADVLSLVFDLDNSVYRENELSLLETSGSGGSSSGSGAIRFGPFSIGGGGGKSSSSTAETGFNQKSVTDITNKNKFAFSGSGSNVGNLLTSALAGFQNLIGSSAQRDAQQRANSASANANIGGGNVTVKTRNDYVKVESGPQLNPVKDTPGAVPVVPQNTGAGANTGRPQYNHFIRKWVWPDGRITSNRS